EHRSRAAGEDHALRPHRPEGLVRLLERHDFAIDLFFAHPPRDELGHLGAQIDDENLVVAGEPIGIGVAHEGGIEDGHPDLMCEAGRVRSRPVFLGGKTRRDRSPSSSTPPPRPWLSPPAFAPPPAGCPLALPVFFAPAFRRPPLFGSFSTRHWLCSLCWRCTDRGKCASGPSPPIRSNI